MHFLGPTESSSINVAIEVQVTSAGTRADLHFEYDMQGDLPILKDFIPVREDDEEGNMPRLVSFHRVVTFRGNLVVETHLINKKPKICQ